MRVLNLDEKVHTELNTVTKGDHIKKPSDFPNILFEFSISVYSKKKSDF